jgi:ribosomal protein S6E (S10)
MVFKINIATKEGKTFKIEKKAEELLGKKIGEKVIGKEISPELEDYEFEITGASDKSGFTHMKGIEGFTMKKALLKYGKGMHKRPKREGKKKQSNPTPGGLRLRKTVRGEVLSEKTSQINLKIIKQGKKKLSEIFPEQNKAPDSESSSEETKKE